MKKFFLSVPVIFTLILTLFAPFSVSAAEISVPTSFNLYPSDDIISPSSFSSQFKSNSASDFQANGYSTPYFLYKCYLRHSTETNIFYNFSYYIYFNGDSSDDIIVEKDSGLYQVSSSSSDFSFGYTSFRCTVSGSNVECYQNRPFSRYNDIHSIDKFIFDSSDNSLYFHRTDNTWTKLKGTFLEADSTFFSYSPGLDLEVKFNPNLSGNIDRIIDQNGVKAESNYFSMEVINHSSKNAQFLFAIVPEGEQFSYNSKDLYGVGLDTESLKSTFFYLSQEWVYSPTITSQLPAKRVDESTYSQITPWHFISADSTIQHSFNWSQVNITKDINYDAVVLAIPTAHDKASKVFLYDKNPHYLSLDDCVEVYRSTFSVENPVKYDSTCEDFGNYPSNGLSGLGKGTVSANAYVDKDTGEVVVEDVSAKDKAEARAEWEPGLIQNDISGFDLSSVKSILGESKAVFNFFGEALAFMPSWFWSLLILGISSIVVIGIIKALK